MSGNAQKTPIAISLQVAAQKKIVDAIALQGKALPAEITAVDGFIVTVKFLVVQSQWTLPTITMPLATSKYGRPPIQVGDQGVVFPADVYLGGVSGLGGGVADLTIPANLSSLVFFPIGNKNFDAPENADAYVIYGPDGAIIKTSDGSCKITVSPDGITMTVPSGKLAEISEGGTVRKLLNELAMTVYNTHTHASNGTPPTQQMDASDLTTVLKAE